MFIENLKKINNRYYFSGWCKSSNFYLDNIEENSNLITYKRYDIEADKEYGFSFNVNENDYKNGVFLADGIEINISKLELSQNVSSSLTKIKNYAKKVLSKGKSNVKSLIYSNNFFNPFVVFKSFFSSFYNFDYLENTFLHSSRNISLEKETQEPFAVAIPIFNGYEEVKKCLESIQKYCPKHFEVWLYEDCSTDNNIKGLIELFKKNNHKWFVNYNLKNLGFVQNCNLIFSKAKKQGINLILLNSDTVIYSKSLENVAKATEQLQTIVTPVSNSASIASFPDPTHDNALISLHMINKINEQKNALACRIPVSVGFCMGIPVHFLKNIGSFDEVFGKGYGEEVDLSMRGNEKSYYSYLFYGAFVYHKHGASFGKDEKKQLNKKNDGIIQTKYPTYSRLINTYFSSEILQKNAVNLFINSLGVSDEVELAINHPFGGGATDYLLNRCKIAGKDIISFEEISQGIISIKIFSKTSENPFSYAFSSTQALSTLKKLSSILEKKPVLLINHLLTSIKDGSYLLEALITATSKSIYLWHDHFAINPNYTLLPKNKTVTCYGCKKCTKSKIIKSEYGMKDLNEWRNKFLGIFKNTDSIIFFSNDSKKHFDKVFKEIDVVTEVDPHQVLMPDQEDLSEIDIKRTSIALKRSAKYHYKILVIGGLSEAKGSGVINDLLTPLKYLDACIIHLGDISEKSVYFKNNYIGLGRYKKNNLKSYLELLNFNKVFIPSIWPETFNYVASEVDMLTTKKIASFNIGAIPERFENKDNFQVLDVEDIENDIFKLAKELTLN